MKKKRVLVVFLILVALILLTSFVSASWLSDLFKKIAGNLISVDVYEGYCIVGSGPVSLPSLIDPDVGPGYAKKYMGRVNNNFSFLKQQCTDAVFKELMQTYCQSNTDGVSWGVVLFKNYQFYSSGSPVSGSGRHYCGDLQTSNTDNRAVCIVRNSYTDSPSPYDPDIGSGYAKKNIYGTNNNLSILKQQCTDAVFQELMKQYCSVNVDRVQWGVSILGVSSTGAGSGNAFHYCENQPCSDSDSGQNYATEGKAMGSNGEFRDYCISNSTLREYYCTANINEVQKIDYTCPFECSFSVCAERPLSELSGACIVKNAYTNSPFPLDPDISHGYAKKQIEGVNNLIELKKQCTDSIFSELMAKYCSFYVVPAWWTIENYSSYSWYGSSTCPLSGCGIQHYCPCTNEGETRCYCLGFYKNTGKCGAFIVLACKNKTFVYLKGCDKYGIDYDCVNGDCTSSLVSNTITTINSTIIPRNVTFNQTTNPPPTSCVNECDLYSSGDMLCMYLQNSHKTCGNYDSDSCLEWGKVTPCAEGTFCIDYGNDSASCLPYKPCVDSDGADIFRKGNVTGLTFNGTFGAFWDYCYGTDYVMENYCWPDGNWRGNKALAKDFYYCFNGCKDGACLPESYDALMTCEEALKSNKNCLYYCRQRGALFGGIATFLSPLRSVCMCYDIETKKELYSCPPGDQNQSYPNQTLPYYTSNISPQNISNFPSEQIVSPAPTTLNYSLPSNASIAPINITQVPANESQGITDNKTTVKINDIGVKYNSSELEIIQEKREAVFAGGLNETGRVYIWHKRLGGNIELKITPEQAIALAKEMIRIIEIRGIELEEFGDKIVYTIDSEAKAKIFGFIGTKTRVITMVNINTGKIVKIKKPWWSFLASGV